MIRRAFLFIDQIVEQLFSRCLIIAFRVHGRQVRRECGNMVIILSRVIQERLFAQLTARPREIKRMLQQVFLRNVIVDLVEMLIHKNFLFHSEFNFQLTDIAL